jgi:hypothetical protein
VKVRNSEKSSTSKPQQLGSRTDEGKRGLESDAEKYFVGTPSTSQPTLIKTVKVLLERLEVDQFGEEQRRQNKMMVSESETKENSPPKKIHPSPKTHFGRRAKRKPMGKFHHQVDRIKK